jgi:general secretion pathway protein D
MLLLSSCTATQPGPAADAAAGDAVSEPAASSLSTSASELAAAQLEQGDQVQPVLYRGNDRQINMPKVREPIRFLGQDVSLNFEKAPLSEVMHAILSDILGLDYVVENPVKGEVTLRTRTPVPREQLLVVLESLLKANNIIMIRGSDDRYLITGAQQGNRLSPTLTNPNSTGAGYSTVVIPLQYISAAGMAEILAPVADDNSFVRVDGSRNLLVMAGTRGQVEGWLDMVSTFDVDLLKGMSVGLFPLENSTVEEVHQALTGLLGQEGKDLNHLVRIIPVNRLNSLLVVTPRSHYLDTLGTWIKRLDAAPASNFEKRLFVYPVQNTTATRLADLLSQIYAVDGFDGNGAGQLNGGVPRDQGGVAPGLSQQNIGTSGNSSGTSSVGSSTGGGAKGGVGPKLQGFANKEALATGQQFLLDDVRVVADEENNALLIYATGKNYRTIEKALLQLDVVATQVIIEASILEVTLSDNLRYGLEWSFNRGLGEGLLVNAPNDTFDLARISPGFSYSFTNRAENVSAMLTALASESLINVISTPSVMVLDNHTAYIHVGDQIPILTDSSVSSDGNRATQSFEYRDTGVKLSVRPSVNAGGLVTMDVEQSVTNVGDVDGATDQTTFLERSINSRVAVRSDEAVVLGGLIQERATNESSGLPWLHEIPVVGALFGVDGESTRRTELLVIITPRVIYNETELRNVSDEMRSHIRHMELIELPQD